MNKIDFSSLAEKITNRDMEFMQNLSEIKDFFDEHEKNVYNVFLNRTRPLTSLEIEKIRLVFNKYHLN